ncbi:MAG: hypothetical protein Q8868_03775 [Bacteroidota bacterium]|nr:hypothetical protein [Bacteroidota bacterium]
MGKRIAIVLVVLLIAGVAVLGYFLHQGREGLSADPFKVIQPDACIIVETTDLQSLLNSVTSGQGLFSEIEKIKEFTGFSTRLKFLADQVNNPAFKKLAQEGPALISFHPSNDSGLQPFLSKAISGELRLRHIKDAFVASGISGINELILSGKKVLYIPFIRNNLSDTAFITTIPGLLICSTSSELIKKVRNQYSPGPDIRAVPGFSRILLSSGKKEDKLFIVFSNLDGVTDRIFRQGGASLSDRISKLGVCAGGDIFINPDGVSLSGYTESTDPSEIMYKYKTVQPAEFRTSRVLPAETALFESIAFSPERQSGNIPASTPDIIVNMAARLRPFLGSEITKAYIAIRNNPFTDNSLVIYELKDRAQCENIFLESMKSKIMTSYFHPDDQTNIPVYFTGTPGLISVLKPGFAQGFSDSWYTFFDNYMITGSSDVTVSRFLYENILNKTLVNDVQYRDFERTLPTRAGYLFYCVPSQILDYLSLYFNEDIIKGLRSNKSSVNKIKCIGFQLAPINGMVYNSLSLRYRDEVMEESPTEWETLLDTTAAIKPFFFTNHNTGAKEIFIQDVKNNAYLINAAGRVLWKVPLKEKIVGSVYMIDYYRNGKYQILFSGRENLHLLDRNGNYVERYPVKLRSPATNSLALFDYDNNGTYRLAISGEDRKIYLYDKSGSVVKGWEPFRTPGTVTTEADFYRVSGKDFIVVADEYSIYFLDRSGNIRIRPKDEVTKAKGSTLRLAPGSAPFLVCTSPDGTIQYIYFDGEVRKFSLRKFSFDHSFDFFDVDGDGLGEYVFIDKGVLYLYDQDRQEMFARDFSSDKLGGPINFIFSSSDRKIGVFDMNKNLIYLVDSKGEIMNGFPLKGASMFSIGKLRSGNEWNLIVGGTDRFLYNYKLDTNLK